MANKDVSTRVIVSAELKGFDTAQQKSAKLSAEAAKGMANQVKGFAEAEKGSIAFGKSMDRLNKMSFKDVQKQIGGLKDNLSSLHKEQLAVTEVMSGIDDQAGPAYEKMKDRLKRIADESKNTEHQISNLTKAFSRQAQEEEKTGKRQGAFVQGMAQGGFPLPGVGLQRGPGMGRQMAGMAVGMGARGAIGAGRGLGAATFGGVQGMATAMNAIPFVGGALAGQFQQAAGYAQQNIEYQRTRLSQAPYIESTHDMESRWRAEENLETDKGYQDAVKELKKQKRLAKLVRNPLKAAARQAKRSGRKTHLSRRNLLSEMVEDATDSIMGKGSDADAALVSESSAYVKSYVEQRTGREMISSAGMNETQKKARYREIGRVADKAISDAEKKVSSARDSVFAREGVSSNALGGVSQMGVNLMGVSKIEATQMAGAIAQAGGGYVDDAMGKGLIGEGFAAKTAYGIGAGTTGAFYGASRRGGLVGGGGSGSSGSAFKDALAEGLEMGFSRSEAAKWMQITAQGIQQFENTGIPINPTSISSLQGEISKAGITGTRAAAMARGITGGLQGIGSRGIQSGTDLMMLQMVGGYKGGGAADYRAARSRMERMDIGGKGVGDIAGDTDVSVALRRVMKMAGGDKASQAELLQQTVTKLGGRGSVRDFDWLARSLRGEEATPEQLQEIQDEQKLRSEGAAEAGNIRSKGGIEGMARKMVRGYAPGAKAQASLANQQIAVGKKMVGIVQKLELASTETTKAFTQLASGPISVLTDSLGVLSKKALETAQNIADGGFIGFGK